MLTKKQKELLEKAIDMGADIHIEFPRECELGYGLTRDEAESKIKQFVPFFDEKYYYDQFEQEFTIDGLEAFFLVIYHI